MVQISYDPQFAFSYISCTKGRSRITSGHMIANRGIFPIVVTLSLLAILFLCSVPTGAQNTADREEWLSLFNGKDLNNWILKIRDMSRGRTLGNRFRVNNGMIQVRYNKYTAFEEQFGHLFYKEPFSHYRLRVEYRFVGEQATGSAGVGHPKQWCDAPFAGSQDDAGRPGLPDFHRVSVPWRSQQRDGA